MPSGGSLEWVFTKGCGTPAKPSSHFRFRIKMASPTTEETKVRYDVTKSNKNNAINEENQSNDCPNLIERFQN